MENFIGHGSRRLTGYGVDRGFYLQANSPHQAPPSQAILARHAGTGRRSCWRSRTTAASRRRARRSTELIDAVFSQGFPIDYLTMCGESFEDAARLQAVFDRLRKHPGVDAMSGECLFCEMASGTMDVPKLHDDELVFAIRDINPRAPVHILVISKQHIADARHVGDMHGVALARMFIVARALAKADGLGERGTGWRSTWARTPG